jgi:DHA1 family bicyclomycin/chloramphenicol resistance-like MFS transporter
MAASMAMGAISIDLMLPAFPEIREAFDLPANSVETGGIITVFFFGLAAAQLVYGPLADRFGRKPVMYAGLAVFVIGTIGAATATTLDGMLVFRFVSGVGAAGSRVISLSIIRDVYEGDQMARVMSFISAVFIFVPVVAPGAGSLLLHVVDWRTLFWATAALAVVVGIWFARIPETLDSAYQIERLEVRSIVRAARIVVGDRQAVGYTLGMTLVFGALVSYLASSELVWRDVYDRGDQFPVIFGGLAAVIGLTILANGLMVNRVGSRRIAHLALFAYVAAAGAAFAVALAAGGTPDFWIFVVLLGAALGAHGLFIPNARAIAILDLGEVAGTASSMIGSFSVLGAAIIGTVIDQAFDGTVNPMIFGFFVGSLGALLIVVTTERGRLFGET